MKKRHSHVRREEPSTLSKTALAMLRNTPEKPSSTTPRNRSSLETLQRFCRHAIKPTSKQAFLDTDNLKLLHSPPPAPPVSSLSYASLGTALQVQMTQSLNNLPTKQSRSDVDYNYTPKKRPLLSARLPPKVKPFTPSAKHRLHISVQQSSEGDLCIPATIEHPSTSVLSSRAMTRLLCDKSVPPETQYNKYMTHLNNRSQTTTKYSRYNDVGEVAIAGGFRLTAGEPKAHQVFQYCT